MLHFSLKKMLAVACVAAISLSASAYDLTVCDGTGFDQFTPIFAGWYDDLGTASQMIYPADELQAIVGQKITAMTFYPGKDDFRVDFTAQAQGDWKFSVKEMEQATFSGQALVTDLLQVGTKANVAYNADKSAMTITFDQPFTYQGGNLLFASEVTAAADGDNAHNMYFYGVSTDYVTALCRYATTARIKWLPKVTFTVEQGDAYAATVLPTEVDFGSLPVNAEPVSKTVTVRNIGQNAFTPSISFDEQSPFASAFVGTELASGESALVEVTFAPETEGEYTGTMTVDCGEAGAFQVALSGNGTAADYTIVVCDGAMQGATLTYDNHLPIFGGGWSDGQLNQMIYPAEKLTELKGKKLTALYFIPYDEFQLQGGKIQVSLGNVNKSVFADEYGWLNEEPIGEDSLTVVGEWAPASGYQNVIAVEFTQPFFYTGANLVIDIVGAAGDEDEPYLYFFGEDMGENCVSFYTNSGYGACSSFLPTVAFAYDPDYVPAYLRGDVNGDGMVDVSDVNIVINIMLGKDSADNYDGRAYLTQGDTTVDVSDVNAVINIMLGKE